MIKKNIKSIMSASFLVLMLCLPFLVFANGVQSNVGVLDKLQFVGDKSGYAEADEGSLARNLGIIVNAALSLLGIIFIILIVYAGIQWMTAGGNEEAVKKAQGKIKDAIIGLVITISAYAIWNLIDRFIISRI
ncbi:MAG: hypothetical protein WC928_03155 [Patescibacteria group bacterium]|jgi:hypothetical protein